MLLGAKVSSWEASVQLKKLQVSMAWMETWVIGIMHSRKQLSIVQIVMSVQRGRLRRLKTPAE